MREYPNVYVVQDNDYEVVAVFYNKSDAEKFVANELAGTDLYSDEFDIFGPLKVV